MQPTTYDRRHAEDDSPETRCCNMQQTHKQPHRTCNGQHATGNMQQTPSSRTQHAIDATTTDDIDATGSAAGNSQQHAPPSCARARVPCCPDGRATSGPAPFASAGARPTVAQGGAKRTRAGRTAKRSVSGGTFGLRFLTFATENAPACAPTDWYHGRGGRGWAPREGGGGVCGTLRLCARMRVRLRVSGCARERACVPCAHAHRIRRKPRRWS